MAAIRTDLTPAPAPGATGSAGTADLAEEVVALVHDLAGELQARSAPRLSLDSTLDGDAGIDSLGRVELLLRIERRFGVTLPEGSTLAARTVRDLLAAIAAARSTPERAVAAVAPSRAPSGASSGAPVAATTLVEVLDWHATHHEDRVHIELCLEDGRTEEITYGRLLERAERVATGLRALGVCPGDSVALMLPTGRDYFYAFVGALVLGAVPVPIYPPHRLDTIEEHLVRQSKILANSKSVVLVTIDQALPLAKLLRARLPLLRSITTADELASHGRESLRFAPGGDATALLQYTSGSTGDPKGVVLTHANLLANIRALGRVAAIDSNDVMVSWLPLYHDMGLIGAWLGSLYFACRLVSMSPLAFLSRPQRWLRAIHEHRGTLSAAPNFAYELCASKLADEDLEGLDLSSWRLAFSGSEPVRPHTVRAFCERFERHGFDRAAFTPAYGLAESSVGLTVPALGRGPRIDRVKRDRFERENVAEPAGVGEEALEFVSCGRALPGHEVRFVDASGREVAERAVGRLEFMGPSATRGYFDNPQATAKLIHAPWVDSGDYGYTADGEVYLTGRVKDLIIRGGRKIYPYELESAVEGLEGVLHAGVAVFASATPAGGGERLVVAAETAATDEPARARLADAIAGLTLDVLHVPADDVVLLEPGTLPKTANGKIRRAACRELHEKGELGRSGPTPRRQLVRFWLANLRPRAARAGRWLRERAFGLWVELVAGVVGVLAALLVTVLPLLAARRFALSVASSTILALTGLRPRILGLENLPAAPCIVAANHGSYLDWLLLAAVLPPRFAFVAKKELEASWLLAFLMRRVGATFVERFDPRQGVEGLEHVKELVRRGQSVVIFPEGTFVRGAGLLPFRMGAFALAAETGAPIVPVALRGTRALLRGEEWLVHRAATEVELLAPIAPRGSDWKAALELRDAVRGRILAGTGEPAIDAR